MKREVKVNLLTVEDITDYLKAFSSKVMAALHVASIELEQHYLQMRLESDEHFFYGLSDESRIVGAIEIQPYGQTAHLYCWLSEEYWGTGFFQEVLPIALAAYFKKRDTEYITAHVYTHNMRSYNALKKTGFIDAGLRNGSQGKQYELVFHRKKVTD